MFLINRISVCFFSLFLLISISHLALAEDKWQDSQDQQEQLEKLKKRISKLRGWIQSAQSEQNDLEKALRVSEQQINSKILQINQLQDKIKKTQNQVGDLERKERTQLFAINQQQHLLAKQVRTAYAMGREQGVKLLLNAEDPLVLQRLMSYYTYLNSARGEQIDSYRDSIKSLQQTRADILLKKQQLIKSRNSLKDNQSQLEKRRQVRQQALAKLNRSLNYKQTQLARMKRDQGRLESLVKEVEKAISNLELTQDSVPFKKLRGKLDWPAKGTLNRNFGSGQVRSPGVFFKAALNEPIKAIHHGRVVFADWLRGFGLLMIIDHGDSYMSLYGFNQALLKEPGDWVTSGEVIASAGNSGGQTQSGLYFEIRHKGKPSNPVRWLKKKRRK